jgi:hypothetical protein
VFLGCSASEYVKNVKSAVVCVVSSRSRDDTHSVATRDQDVDQLIIDELEVFISAALSSCSPSVASMSRSNSVARAAKSAASPVIAIRACLLSTPRSITGLKNDRIANIGSVKGFPVNSKRGLRQGRALSYAYPKSTNLDPSTDDPLSLTQSSRKVKTRLLPARWCVFQRRIHRSDFFTAHPDNGRIEC